MRPTRASELVIEARAIIDRYHGVTVPHISTLDALENLGREESTHDD